MADVDFSVCVVLPASGTGERCGSEPPKQFTDLIQKPLILHTLDTFHRIPWVEHIIVPVSAKYETFLNELVSEYSLQKVTVTHGAGTRHRSIYAGIKVIPTVCESPCVVLVHDAVRLFADTDTIKAVALNAHQHGASGVTRPLVSTVISSSSSGYLEESLDRNKYKASEMPQGFRYDIIKAAYDKATDFDFDYGTECLLLAKKYTDTRAHLLEGDDNLWKVTYRKDIYAAEGMLKENLILASVTAGTPTQPCDTKLVDHLRTKCQQRRIQLITEDDGKTDCNTHVFYYPDCDTGSVVWNTNSIQSIITDGTLLIGHCIVHVCCDGNHSIHHYVEFLGVLQKLAKQLKGREILIYGVYDQTSGAGYDKVAEMVASVMWNRDPVMNGQVYIVTDGT